MSSSPLSDTAPTDPNDTRTLLDLEGMTCASCAGRIERKLNKLPGVEAQVNFALQRASVRGNASADALVQAVRDAGYDAKVVEPERPREDPDVAAAAGYRRRFFVSAALALPVMVMAMVPALQFPGWQWVSAALALPVVTWGAWPFHKAAAINLRHGATTMDTLVSIGVSAATLWSLYALFFGHAGMIGMRHEFEGRLTQQSGTGNVYFEVAAGVTAFLLLGRWMEARAKREAGSALRALLDLGAHDVEVLGSDGAPKRIPIGELRVGDRFRVRPGERVATDARIVEGRSAIDTSMLTGESVPVEVAVGDEITGATVNTWGALTAEAIRVGADTQLARMSQLVEDAQTGKARAQRLADRISSVFVPVVLVLALLTFAGWLVFGGTIDMAFTAAVAVLIIACPCALGLATPTAILAGTGRGARLGILIRGPEALEQARKLDVIVLDKTGTITSGRMALADVLPEPGVDGQELLALAASVEGNSEHPIARAIVAGAADAELPASTNFENSAGRGAEADVNGARVTVGRGGSASAARVAEVAAAGRTAVAVERDGKLLGILTVADEIRPGSARAVGRMRELGMTPVLLTGDHEQVARAVAAEVGIDEVRAGVLPEQKAQEITRLQANGRRVAMVGDGVNDAPALATADLGIAMGGGTDAAMEAADITLVGDDLGTAVDGVRLSRASYRVIVQNLFWAFAYNAAAIPLAAFGLLSPMLAGAAMAFSSVFVVLNSLRLLRFKYPPLPRIRRCQRSAPRCPCIRPR